MSYLTYTLRWAISDICHNLFYIFFVLKLANVGVVASWNWGIISIPGLIGITFFIYRETCNYKMNLNYVQNSPINEE